VLHARGRGPPEPMNVCIRRALLASGLFALISGTLAARAQETESASVFGDLQIRSGAEATEIVLELPVTLREEDRTQKRPGLSASGQPARVATPAEAAALPEATPTPEAPTEATPTPEGEGSPVAEATPRGTPTPRIERRAGALTANEIHLFFPGVTIPRARLITVDDRIIQEARLFPDQGGVSMTVVARRPIYYVVARAPAELRIHVEPGTLLASEAAGAAGAGKPTVMKGARQRNPRSSRVPGGIAAPEGGEQLVPRMTLPPMRKGEGLTVDAEHLSADEEKNEIIAQGHVTIARASSLLTAEEVRINRDTQRAEAKGNVQFTDPQGTLQSDTFSGNLEDETGVLTNGNIYLGSNHLTITGSKLEKSFGQTYHIENGEFTTCQCGAGAPSWSIAGKSIDVTLDGYGIVDNAKLKVLDTPVLYLPWMAFPAKKTRQTGLLAPLFGYSKKRGFTYTQPLFVVINKGADFTIAPDIETSARVGAVTEYRYALDEHSKGILDFSYFNELLRNNADRDIVDPNVADPHIPKDRWSVTADLRQELPFEIRAFADALAVSDDFFLREIPTFSFDPEYARSLRTSRFTSSRGGFYRFWEHATLIAQAQYFQDFIQEDDLTLQRLPQVQLFASDRFLDRHLKLGLNGEFVDFVRRKGFDGPRVDVNPSATVPYRWKEYFNGNLQFQVRETAYHLNNTDLLLPVSETGGVTTPSTTQTLDKNPTRELYQASAVLGTQIARVFDVGGENVQRLKHTIEPEVDYLFVPDVNQDQNPIYDFADRINRRNLVTYGFTSRLLAKLDRPPSEDYNRRPTSIGDLNTFSGVSPAPFGDENTRGGLSVLGDPRLSGPTPTGIGASGEEAAREEESPTATTEAEAKGLTPAELAAKRIEERSAMSHVAEWARLQVFQSYDLRDSLQTNKEDHFSDVDVHLRLLPRDYFSLLYDSTVNARDERLTSANVGFVLRDPRSRTPEGFLTATQRASVGISYRFIANQVLQEVDGGLVVPLADTVSVFYQSRYDALDKQFLEKTGGFRLISQCRCWIADVSVSDRINPQETEVRFQITLIGLGSIGRTR
jgi:lipopolysaccharide assembly outer membrane protein LptD (OstA)